MRGLILPIAGLALAGALVAPDGGAPASAATQNSFQPVGNLAQDRDGAQVTRLTDGTVLVTGGNHCVGNNCAALASAEVFDPKTNQFTAIGAMTSPRDDSHRSMLLKDGRVLITGGSPDYQNQLRSAELFDLPSRTFTAVGDMTEGRAAHTTTMLPDARVLVAGGYSVGGPAASAELFDPVTGRFQKTGPMKQSRYRHSAVALPDGRVVVLGGYGDSNQTLRGVEIYDPKTGTFAAQGLLAEGRGDMTATLLPDSRILVVGGAYALDNHLAGRKSVEIYDPATGQSVITDSLPDARANQVAALLADGQILVAGGTLRSTGPDAPVRTAAIIDPTTGNVSAVAPMTVPRAYPSGVALLDGRVLILGGDGTDGSSLATADVYVPASPSGQTSP